MKYDTFCKPHDVFCGNRNCPRHIANYVEGAAVKDLSQKCAAFIPRVSIIAKDYEDARKQIRGLFKQYPWMKRERILDFVEISGLTFAEAAALYSEIARKAI